jgi:hypothetical protein
MAAMALVIPHTGIGDCRCLLFPIEAPEALQIENRRFEGNC